MYASRLALAAGALALFATACGTSTETTTSTPGTTAAPATTEAPTTTGAPTTTASPTTTTPTPDPVKNLIQVTTPGVGDLVTSPLTVTGMSNTFEAVVNYRLSAGGTVLAEGFTMGGSGELAPFEAVIEFENTCCIEMLLEVFEISAKDGTEINLVSIPLTFPESS